MKAKRVLCVLFVIAMLTPLMAGCHQTKPPAIDTTVMDTTATEPPATQPDTTTGSECDTEEPPVLWGDYVTPEGADFTDLQFISGSKPTTAQSITYSYPQNADIFTMSEAKVNGSSISFYPDGVHHFGINSEFDDGTVATYSFKIQVVGGLSQDAPWFTQFIGLRLDESNSQATSRSGVWLAIRDREIGLRVDAWPNVSYMSIQDTGVLFSDENVICVEDDMESDTITVSVDRGEGDPVTVAVIRINGSTIGMYRPGESTPAIVAEGMSVPPTGRMNLWSHGLQHGGTVFTDFTVKGYVNSSGTSIEANMMNSLDVFSDLWVAVDDEGRFSGTDNRAVTDKQVGIFYFLWHTGQGIDIYDHYAAWLEGGADKVVEVIPKGPLGQPHYWAEPYFGYYRSTDKWVIRKHTEQLNAAGVDFIYIDASNGLTYRAQYEAILEVWTEMRADGHKTPQIMFFCGNSPELAAQDFKELWSNLYSRGRYEELWFRYKGKPLIILPSKFVDTMTDEQRDFFTIRQSWHNTGRKRNVWAWAHEYPQAPGHDAEGNMEQMVVMSGYWANGYPWKNIGRSCSVLNGGQPANLTDFDFGFSLTESGLSGKGIAFQEQFNRALEYDPSVIMMVGWNEWWAGRWEAGAAVSQTIANTYVVTDTNEWTRHYYVDNFNPEFSRDIEPMKGGFNDNYYYQMVMNVRAYKGTRQNLAAFGQRPIVMSDAQSQWDIVGPEYRDYEGDTMHRDALSNVGTLHYVNKTGRNDIVLAKVSVNDGKAFFYVECADDITVADGTNWMNLYVNSDCDHATGWYGYDYVINRDREGETCSVMKFANNSWDMDEVCRVPYTVQGNYIQVQLDTEVLGLGDTFDFKWADNSVDSGDIMQFIDLGDAAPNDRFNYRYTAVETEISIPQTVTEDMIVLKAGSYYAFVGGEMVRLDESSTKAVFLGDDEHLYLPFEVAKAIGLAKDGDMTYNHYGVKYVDISRALTEDSRIVTRSEDMIVIGATELSEDAMRLIYRALY